MEGNPGISILINGHDEIPRATNGLIQVKAGDQPKILLKPMVTKIDKKMEALDPFWLDLCCDYSIVKKIIFTYI